ncbi:MAG: TIGR04066 family peptide maturation system protein [Candidatus Galacturonibacter soehngenii]|nr:TIGR04066 family peptide maturation system protein [Candidatus Galacturonibacter soehngenii]
MRVFVYPYDEDFEIFLMHKGLLDLEIKDLLSPVGWGVKNPEGYVIKTQINQINLEEMDAMLLIDSNRFELSEEDIMLMVLKAVKNNMAIVLNRCVTDELLIEIKNLCKGASAKLIDLRKTSQYDFVNSEKLQTIDTPIVTIVGMGQRCNKFETQVSIKVYLEKLGYRVCVVSSRRNTEFAGIHGFPDFMYGNQLDETTKIIHFNHYIKKLEQEEQPEIILVGVPGSIMPVSKTHPEHFGVFAFEVLQAIQSDMLIFCMHHNIYKDQYFEELKNLTKYRLQTELDAFVIGNDSYDSFSIEAEGNLKYLTFDNQTVSEAMKTYPPNVYSRQTYDMLAQYVLETLAEYADYQVM